MAIIQMQGLNFKSQIMDIHVEHISFVLECRIITKIMEILQMMSEIVINDFKIQIFIS